MRASIPALFIMYLLFIETFSVCFHKKKYIIALGFMLLFLIGSITPLKEFNRLPMKLTACIILMLIFRFNLFRKKRLSVLTTFPVPSRITFSSNILQSNLPSQKGMLQFTCQHSFFIISSLFSYIIHIIHSTDIIGSFLLKQRQIQILQH